MRQEGGSGARVGGRTSFMLTSSAIAKVPQGAAGCARMNGTCRSSALSYGDFFKAKHPLRMRKALGRDVLAELLASWGPVIDAQPFSLCWCRIAGGTGHLESRGCELCADALVRRRRRVAGASTLTGDPRCVARRKWFAM